MSKFRLKFKNQEKRAADSIGGNRQPGSGAFSFHKGDAIGENYLCECKRTDNKSISIKGEVLDKITKEAAGLGKIPILAIELQVGDPFTSKNWIVMEKSHFENITDGGKR